MWVNTGCSTHSNRGAVLFHFPHHNYTKAKQKQETSDLLEAEGLFTWRVNSPFLGRAAQPWCLPALSSHCHQRRRCWNDLPDSVHLFHGSPGLLLLRKKQMDP